ncbi:MAG TPA: PAS domain S-box protein [bacterium]
MEQKSAGVRRELDRIVQEWAARTAFIGAAMCLALGPLDFYAVPGRALRFLAYRCAVSAWLVAVGLFLRRPRPRATVRAAILLGVLASVAVLEAMILEFGGHESPYVIGLVLVAVTVLGLVPAGPAVASAVAGATFAAYVGPMLFPGAPLPGGSTAVEVVLFAAFLGALVLVNWLNRRRIAQEIALRHDLTLSHARLEAEAAGRARADAELRESQGLLASIAAAVPDAIVMLDPEGRVRYWNTAAERIFGHPAADVLGREAIALLVPPDKAGDLAAEHRAWLGGGRGVPAGRRLVTQGRRSDGESFPMELAMSAVERGGRLWTCALLRDVTDRTRNEDRLRLFAAAVEGAAEGFYIVGLDGRILYVNPAGRTTWGPDPGAYIGRGVAEMHQFPERVASMIMPGIMRAGSWAGEVTGTKDGQRAAFWLTASLVRDDAGRPIAMVGITTDLAAQRRLEEERIRAQKLESIGVLAGGLAHDFNNLLTIILGNLDLARLFAGTIPDAAEALDHASEAALRAGDLTRQLITFSKGGHPVKRVASIARTLRETVSFAATGSNVSCVFDLPEDLPAVEFDEGQMRQVIHNLVQNAREAMPGGGELRVGARALQVAEGGIEGLPAGRYLRLDFHDCGSGIERDHLSRIFDPYFSTKEMDTVKGRGLGLAVSFSIVRNHGGTMTAESSPATGTTVSVYLPESAREPDEEEEEDEEPAPEGAGGPGGQSISGPEERAPEGPAKGRVLVMDDEPLVLDMAGAVLRRLGYAATLARSGAEAIVQYQIALEAGRSFDAVVLDLTVPGGLGGPEALARLREIDPGVRAALSSGHVDHPAVADWPGAGFAAFIPKPYTIRAFEEALARLL